MRTLKLILTGILLLSFSEVSCYAEENEALSVIREMIATQTRSTRKPAPQPTRKSDPAQQPTRKSEPAPQPTRKSDPAQQPTRKSKKAPVTEPDPRARNIYALFMEANPKLSPALAKKYAEIVIDVSDNYKQDSYVIAAIIVHESTVNNKAVSKGGDYGLMQVRWKVHEKAIKQRFPNVKNAHDMFDARTNIMFGTEIFRDCMRKANNDVPKGLMRYSAGNTKMRDKVMSTVRDLRANDNAAKTVDILKQKKKGK